MLDLFQKEYYEVSANYLKERFHEEPDVALILGSGLGPLADKIENKIEVLYKDIPNFLVSTNPMHAGKMIFGNLAGKKVVCMSGRFHSYEGYSMEQLAIPVRVLSLLGAKKLIVTNAAGAVNMDYKPGDIMIISDHLKFPLESPMCGPNVEDFGPRFFDVSKMYTPELRILAKECAKQTNLTVHEGTYFFMPGPQFETPAEIKAIRVLGGDAVGMSTVTEALTAAHLGMQVLGFSVLTNMAAGILDQPITDEEVNEIGNMISSKFSSYIETIIEKM